MGEDTGGGGGSLHRWNVHTAGRECLEDVQVMEITIFKAFQLDDWHSTA